MFSKEIKVISVDEIRTHKTDSEGSTYNVYFELSLVPSNEWKNIFENQNSAKQNLRKFWVDGRHIVVQCLFFNEIEDMLTKVKKEVAITNQKYREHAKNLTIAKIMHD